MRTGANFARGSCRALKWVALFGAVVALGTGQAAAQTTITPSIETAVYVADSPVVTITMSDDVFFGGDSEDRLFLPDNFTLTRTVTVGGTTTAKSPFRIDGLPSTITSADDSFTLVFDTDIDAFRATGATLTLTYTQDGTRTASRILSETRTPLGTTSPAITVAGPTESSVVTLDLTAVRTELQKARKIGTPIAGNGTTLPYATRNPDVGIVLPAATGPGTPTYALGPATALADLGGLAFDATTRALTGTLTGIPMDRLLEYTATVDTNVSRQFFTIKVANVPDAPVVGTNFVTAAGPSSLKLTWGVPSANNATIMRYEVSYKAVGEAVWLDALIPDAVNNALATSRTPSYTIEGLAPGAYDVRVRAANAIDAGAWAVGRGETGAAPGTPTLTLTMDSELDEERNQIPVTVTATVPPSAQTARELRVTLWIAALPGTLPEDAAEIPNTAGIAADVAWASSSPGASLPSFLDPNGRGRVLTLGFNSNLSSEAMAYLNTAGDDDAEDEAFRIRARAVTRAGDDFATSGWANQAVLIDDDEVQEYKLQLDDVALESSGMFDEGYGDEPVTMDLIVSPARTLPKSFFVNLESAQDARDYSLSSGGTSSGGPTAVSLRIDMAAGEEKRDNITLTAASNDGDRVDDTITLQMFETSAASPTTAGDMIGDAIMLTVVDQHKLPKVTMGSIMVDGAAVTSLKEGETGTVTLMADRGTATDDVPDSETITVALTHGAASSASAADYSLSSEMVTISGTSGTFMLEVLEDDQIDAEELVLQAAVTGVAMYGDAADMVDLGPISLMDGTTKLVYPKTDEEIQAVIYPAKEAGMGDDMMFNPGETIEIASPGSLFNSAEGVTLSFTAESDMEDVATVAVSGGGMVTVTAQDMAGVMAHITITAHASVAATAAKGLPQTDPSEASIIFPVEVGLEALSFMLTGPEDMNLVEGGMGGMVTATANREVTADVTINLMRDRAMSTADDMDFMAEAITIEAGMMSGTTMVMAEEDSMMEDMEELVLYGMAADNAGEVTGQVMFYIWDDAVPALPIIAQLLLAALMAIGGYRRYRRR